MADEKFEKGGYSSKGAPSATGVVKFPKSEGQLAIKFIEPGKTFDDALTCTRIIGFDLLKNIILLHTKFLRFNEEHLFDPEIQSLISLLNGIRSINGIGMSLAVMTDVDIYYPQGAGMEMSKEDKEALLEINRIKHGQRNNRYESDED